MTTNEILTAVVGVGSAALTYSAQYIGKLLKKKTDDTIVKYDMENLKKRVLDIEAQKLDKRMSVLEERTKHLNND